MEYLKPVSEWSAAALELLGIATILLVAVYAAGRAVVQLFQGLALDEVFRYCRLRISRAILMGLEFLVAADIIYILAIEWNSENLGALAMIILIRAFLIITLELEITGRWPWQRKGELPP